MNDELVRTVIDLNAKATPELAEGGYYSQFSLKVNDALLGLYYAGISQPLSLKGTPTQIESFTKALSREKKYMDSYLENGLNDSRTLNNRHNLMDAVKRFEQETGLRWPYKN